MFCMQGSLWAAGKLLLVMGFLGRVILATVASGGRRNKRKNDGSSSKQESDHDVDDVEAATPPRRRALRSEDGESSDHNDVTSRKEHICRFCPMKFEKPQALGGHMNRHRTERENETHQKALNLVNQARDQAHFGAPRWNTNIQGQVGGESMLSNTAAPMGVPNLGPQFQPNQSDQNWLQISQFFASQQAAINTLQQLQAGGSYCNPLDNERGPHQGSLSHPQAHPQHHLVNPGQSSTQQMAGYNLQQSAAETATWMQNQIEGAYQVTQPGPSPLEEVVMRSNRYVTQSNSPFRSRTPQSNAQIFVDEHGNSTRTPLNAHTHFQTRGQDDFNHGLFDPDEAGGSGLRGDMENQINDDAAHNLGPEGEIYHMLNLQPGQGSLGESPH